MKLERSRKVLIRLVFLWLLSEEHVLFKSSWRLFNLDPCLLFWSLLRLSLRYAGQGGQRRFAGSAVGSTLVWRQRSRHWLFSGNQRRRTIRLLDGCEWKTSLWHPLQGESGCEKETAVQHHRDEGINYTPGFRSCHKQTAHPQQKQRVLQNLSLVLPWGQMFK